MKRLSEAEKARLSTPEALAVLDLEGCPRGRGRNYARVVWLVLAGHLRWGSETHKTFAGNERIAALTGLSLRSVELGIAYLHRAKKIARAYGLRGRGNRRSFGRILTLNFEGRAPVVRLPDATEAREMLTRIKRLRQQPTATFAVAYAAHVLARAEVGKLKRSHTCATTMTAICRLLGMTRSGVFNERLRVLEDVGVLAQRGARWCGFIIFGQLVEPVLEQLRRMLPAAPIMRTGVGSDAEERLAAMSEAAARLYSGSKLALVG